MPTLTRILDAWREGGPLLPFLAAVSLGIWYLIFRESARLRVRTGLLRALHQDLEACGGEGECVRSCLRDHGDFDSQALLRAMETLPDGGGHPLSALEEIENRCLEPLTRNWLLLAALTAAAPLLGLLGTVGGMIQTFDAVGGGGGSTGARVADGIRAALVTTQFGLVIAMPGVFGAAHLRGRLRELRGHFSACRFLLLEASGRAQSSGDS